jgi:hypothetical protein
MEDGALLSASYDPDATLALPAASDDSTSGHWNRRIPVKRPNEPTRCDRKVFVEQAAKKLSTSEAQAVQEVLDRALKLGYKVEWGKGKSCSYKLSYAGIAHDRFFRLTQKVIAMVNRKGQSIRCGMPKRWA